MTKLKFKLTDETIEVFDKTLHRIEALKDFSNIKKGDKGGFIEKEENLSHLGNAWVYDDAKVFDNAVVKNNAKIRNHAQIYGHAHIVGNARVCGMAQIYGNSIIGNYARIHNEVIICG